MTDTTRPDPIRTELDRRAFLRAGGLAVGGFTLLGFPGLLSACGGSSTSTQKSSPASASTGLLRIPFLADMQVPDPDIFYEGEGLQVTLSCYEGLVQYAPDSAEIAPLLAESWTVSDDKLTYTFKMRSGLKFADGSPCDAGSMVSSFKRRTDVAGGGAYMVADVASATAPDPGTFVVVLKHRIDAFLDYMACPWSPKAVNPALVAQNTVGTDLGKKWLETHSAGTGPYVIKEFAPSSHYVLEANPNYWNGPSAYKEVRIDIIPDVSTQRLKLESGDLDMITKGLPIEDIRTLEKSPNIVVKEFPIATKEAIYVNPKGGIFADQEVRLAFLQAIDRTKIITPAWQDTGAISSEFYSPVMFKPGLVPDKPVYDPSKLKALVPKLKSKKVDLAYCEDGGAPRRRATELVQTQLQALGLDVQVRAIPTSQVFALADGDPKLRPDLLAWVAGGDALHVDTVLRIFFRTGATPLNWCNYADPAVDAAMDEGLAGATREEVEAGYVKAAQLIQAQGWMLNLADMKDVIVARKGISNFVHDPQAVQMVRLHDLKSA